MMGVGEANKKYWKIFSITSMGWKVGGFFAAFIYCLVVRIIEFFYADGQKVKLIGEKRKKRN